MGFSWFPLIMTRKRIFNKLGIFFLVGSFLVDNIPIRVFKNAESLGVPFPKSQPMRIYSSLWNADDWATRGGLVKTDWSKAPFTAYYRNFNFRDLKATNPFSYSTWQTNELDAPNRRTLRWVQKYFMIYNYCSDLKRFPQGAPPECKSRFWTFKCIVLIGWCIVLINRSPVVEMEILCFLLLSCVKRMGFVGCGIVWSCFGVWGSCSII